MIVQKSYNAVMYRLPVGPMFWWTDAAPSPPAAPGRVWVLPPWLPQKLYIVGATFGQQEDPDGKVGQFAIGIDRKGLSARNALAPLYQVGGDTQWDEIGDIWTNRDKTVTTPQWGAPKLLDRAAGDRLWIQNDVQAFGTDPNYRRTLWFRLEYEVDDAWVPPAPSGWTSMFGCQLPTEGISSGWGGYSIAAVFDADLFYTGAGSQLRVTIAADHISSATIGALVPNTLQQTVADLPLTFGGNAGAAANASGVIISDAMPFGLDPGNGLVVKFRIDSAAGAIKFRETHPSIHSYYKAPGAAGYSLSAYDALGTVNVEQFY
jgi:hypothetical protein